MVNLISQVFSRFISLFQAVQLKRFLVVTCMSLLLLTTSTQTQRQNHTFTKDVDVMHQDDGQRPRNTREWEQEARETEGQPGERLKRIVKESGDALKDLGEVYPDTAKRSANELKDNMRD